MMGFWGHSPSMRGQLYEWYWSHFEYIFSIVKTFLFLSFLHFMSPCSMPFPSDFLYSMVYLFSRNLKNKIEETEEATRRAVSLPLLLCHGKGICVCEHKYLCYFRYLMFVHQHCLSWLGFIASCNDANCTRSSLRFLLLLLVYWSYVQFCI